MLGDEDKTARANTVYIIQKIRYAEEENQEGEQDPVRKFHLLWCNFAATSSTDLTTLKGNSRGNDVTYLTPKKVSLVLKKT